MHRIVPLSFLTMTFFIVNVYSGPSVYNSGFTFSNDLSQDTVRDNQFFLNGRYWRNLYPLVQDHQFLFTRELLSGSVTMRGKTFSNVRIRYDIFKDEIMTPGSMGGILQLNKEMVDSFSLFFQNKRYQFIRIPYDSVAGPEGYCNVLYDGKHALYAKYDKKIEKFAVEGKYDRFYQVTRIYLLKEDKFHLLRSKNDLMRLLKEDKTEIRNFITRNKLKISKEDPASFIPVISYLDTLR